MPAHRTVGSPMPDRIHKIVETFMVKHIEADPATVSVWLGDLDATPLFARDEDEVHYAASTMKLPLLVAAYRRHERGDLDLDAEVPVHNAFASALDGSPFSLDQDDDQDDETWALLGGTAPLRRLVRHAIVKSGNLATNLVLEHVGAGEVAAVLADAGCSEETVLPRGIEDAAAREYGLDNHVTAADLGRVMAALARGDLADPRTCAAIEAVLADQEHREMIPAGLPEGTYVANKTGWVTGVTHDVALVRPDGTRPDEAGADGTRSDAGQDEAGAAAPYVLAVCTTVDVPEEDAAALIARISQAAWDGVGR